MENNPIHAKLLGLSNNDRSKKNPPNSIWIFCEAFAPLFFFYQYPGLEHIGSLQFSLLVKLLPLLVLFVCHVFALLLDLTVVIISGVQPVLPVAAVKTFRLEFAVLVIILHQAGYHSIEVSLFNLFLSIWVIDYAGAVEQAFPIFLLRFEGLAIAAIEPPGPLGLQIAECFL